jgi:signal transduction histidine kinase
MGAHEDTAGGLWFNHYGNGLFHITPDDKIQRLTAPEDLPDARVGAWFQSSDGGVWAGLDHGGLARLRDRRFHVIGAADGLGARTALSVCEEQPGAMWIGTAGGGLCLWTNGMISHYAAGASAAANIVFAIAPRPGGGAWLSAAEGEDLYQFFDGQIRRVSWDVHGIKSMLADSKGRVWMGTKYGIAFSDGRTQRILGTNNAATLPAVRALAETSDGNVWAGADDGTVFRCEPDRLTPFRPTDELAHEPVYSLMADGGTLWIGTYHGGLLRFRGGEFSRITAKHGLPVDVISQILEDGRGRLWLGTHQGICSVAKSALHAVADGRTNRLDYVIYGRHDGMASPECSEGYQPACCRAADGKLWFTTVRGGVVWVDPNEVVPKWSPPPILIEELHVDGEPVALSGEKIIVPPGRKQLDFRYTALNFDAGERTRFRYRVDGWDTDWEDVDTRRTVSLRNLPAREYRFNVIACNSQGEWNETGASVAFVVRPFFYQTLAFKIIAGILVVGGISFAVRRAVTRKYRRKLALLQQQHAIERDRARIAKDIHDDIGAGLTQITLLTELARRGMGDGNSRLAPGASPEPKAETPDAYLERISSSARKLTKAMDEIVWAVDPQHDTFEGLMDYVSAYAEDFLRVAGIRCRMDLPPALPVMQVDAELRYNLFLALKEALNNVVKHAKATEVWLRLKIAADSFTFVVEDNGSGLPAVQIEDGGSRMADGGAPGPSSIFHSPSSAAHASSDRLASGSGLGNLRKRLAAIGGDCTVQSAPGQGTRVTMTVRIHSGASPILAIGGGAATD